MSIRRKNSDNDRLRGSSQQTPALGVSGIGQLMGGGSLLRSSSLTSDMGMEPPNMHLQLLSSLSSSAGAVSLSHSLNNSGDKTETSNANSSGESSNMSSHLIVPKPNPFNKTFPLETLPTSKHQLSSLHHSSTTTYSSSRGKGSGMVQGDEGAMTPTKKVVTRRKSSHTPASEKVGDASSSGGEKKSGKRSTKGSKTEGVGSSPDHSAGVPIVNTLTSVDDTQIMLTPLKQKSQMTTDTIVAQFSSSLPNPSALANATFNGALLFSGSGTTTPPPPLVSSTSVTPMMNKHKTIVPNPSTPGISSSSSNTRKLTPVSSLVTDGMGSDGTLLLESATEKKAKKVVKRRTSHGTMVMSNAGVATSSPSGQGKRNTEMIAPITHSTASGGTAAGPVVITPIEACRRRKSAIQNTTIDVGTNAYEMGNVSDDASGRSRGDSMSGSNNASGYNSANEGSVNTGTSATGSVTAADHIPLIAQGQGQSNSSQLMPVAAFMNSGTGCNFHDSSNGTDNNNHLHSSSSGLLSGGGKALVVDINSKKHRLQHNDMLIRDKLQQGLAMNQKQKQKQSFRGGGGGGGGGSSTVGIAVSVESSNGASNNLSSGSSTDTANPFAASGLAVAKNPFASSGGTSLGMGGNVASNLSSSPPARAAVDAGVNDNPGAIMHKFSLWSKKSKLPATSSGSSNGSTSGVTGIPFNDMKSHPAANPFASNTSNNPFSTMSNSSGGTSVGAGIGLTLGLGGTTLSSMSTPLASISTTPTGAQSSNFFGSSGGKMAARLRGITADHDEMGLDPSPEPAASATVTGTDVGVVLASEVPPLGHSVEPNTCPSGSLANSLRQMIDHAGPTSVSSSTDQQLLRRSQDSGTVSVPDETYFGPGSSPCGKDDDLVEITEELELLGNVNIDTTSDDCTDKNEQDRTQGGAKVSSNCNVSLPIADCSQSRNHAASDASAYSNGNNRSHLTIEEEEKLKHHHLVMLGRLGSDGDGDGDGDGGGDGEGELQGSDDELDEDGIDDDQLLANRMSSSRTVSPALSEMSQSLDDAMLFANIPSFNSCKSQSSVTSYKDHSHGNGSDNPAIVATKVNMSKRFTNSNYDCSYNSDDDDDGMNDAQIVVPVSQITSSTKKQLADVDGSFRSVGSIGNASAGSYSSTNYRRNGSAGSFKNSAATMLATLCQPNQQNVATIRTIKNKFGRPGSGHADTLSSRAGANDSGESGQDRKKEANAKEEVNTGSLQLLKWKKGRQIGEGSFGRVFQGMNTTTGESLAIKQLVLVDGSGEEVRRLQQEIDVMEGLSHPNIVRYIGTSISPQYLYILLEYVTGGSIAKILKQFGPIDEELLRKFTYHITCGVEYLHLKGIIHRDIKGGNVLVTDGGIAKLSDFGCSKRLVGMCTASLEESLKVIKGSVPWMAPEVIKQSGFGRSSDIWSVGATMIEMATARLPWPNFTNDLAAMFHVATSKEPPPIPEHLSPECVAFIESAMQIDAKARPSATDMLHVLPFLGPLVPTDATSDNSSSNGAADSGTSVIVGSAVGTA